MEQVLYYLVRVEPYSTLAIQLQGGKFDHADRMFSDIGSTWNGNLEDMSDVKELVSNCSHSNNNSSQICFRSHYTEYLLSDFGSRCVFDILHSTLDFVDDTVYA